MKSIHPFEPYIPEGAKKLVIGTIPPPRFCRTPQELFKEDVNFYYGSKDNYFWHLIQESFDKELQYENSNSAIEQRKNLLKEISIGITDIIAECTHKDNSASDDHLKEIVYKDIEKLLENNISIDTLVYTSEFVKKEINKIFKTHHSIDSNNKKKQTIKIANRIYKVKVLFSPSPQALINMGKDGAAIRRKQYREFLS
jgi:G:T/U-mismatch repair DNA glycosylase